MTSVKSNIEKFQSSKRIYLLASIILFIMLLFILIRSQFFFSAQDQKARVINYAGRQRMISQKLSKMAFLLEANKKDHTHLIQEMKVLDENWSKIHQALRYGDKEMGITPIKNNIIDSLFQKIQPHKDSISNAVALLSHPKITHKQYQAGLANILKHEGKFLSLMDQLVKQYENEVHTSIGRIRIISASSLSIVILLFFLIFRPAVSLLIKQNNQIKESLASQEKLNQELLASDRELKRTREFLEQTNQIALVGGWEVDLVHNQIYWTEITRKIHEVDDHFEPDIESAIQFYKEGFSRDTITKSFYEAIEKGISYEAELQIISAKGTLKWIRAMGIPEFKDGTCVRVYGTFQNIEKQKKNEEHLRLLESVVTNVKDAIIITEAEPVEAPGPKIIFVNRAFCNMTGYEKNEVIGKTPSMLQGENTNENELNKIRMALKQKIPFEAELINYKKNGDQFWNSISVVPLRSNDGEFTHWIAISRDITPQKINEQKIIAAKAQAESANLAKSEFLANMSHEIRTPLNGVIGFSDLLTKTELNESQYQYMQAIHTSANALLDLINDILDFSKIEAGKVELSYEKTNIWELLEQVMDIVKYKVEEKNLELLLSMDNNLPMYAHIDQVRLRQILINLMSNAVKFTESGEIELSVQCISIDKAECKINFFVRDTGIGIAPKRQKAIFSAFSQEDASTTRKYGGTGLGLSISNQLLKMMNSKLELESTQGVGSKFSFTLTLKTENGHYLPEEALPINHALIVDDHKKNCQIIQEILKLNNITSDIAHNGTEALNKVKENLYDVMIIDYYMPDMNGIEVIKEIRQTLGVDSKQLPIILSHSSANDAKINKHRNKLQIQRVITKPVTINLLSQTLLNLHVTNYSPEREDQSTQEHSDHKLSILLVDDNPMNRKLVISMLSQILPNAVVEEATDGLEAINAFIKNKADLILMDVQMPNLSGYEASKRIRKLTGGKYATIIALTAGTVVGEKERCLEAGMDDYLSKPIVLKTLKDRLFPWLENHSPDTQAAESEYQPISMHFDLQQCKINLNLEDMATLEVLVGVLITQLDEEFPLFLEARDNKDMQTILKLSHKHKSSTATVSMQVLAELFKKLEDQTEFLPKEINALLQQIELEIEQVKALVHESFNNQNTSSNQSTVQ